MKKILAVLGMSIFLFGCTTQPMTLYKPTYNIIQVSDELFFCKDVKMRVPDPATLTNREIKQYILKLRGALDRCQVDNGTIDSIIKEFNKRVEEMNKESNNGK